MGTYIRVFAKQDKAEYLNEQMKSLPKSFTKEHFFWTKEFIEQEVEWMKKEGKEYWERIAGGLPITYENVSENQKTMFELNRMDIQVWGYSEFWENNPENILTLVAKFLCENAQHIEKIYNVDEFERVEKLPEYMPNLKGINENYLSKEILNK